MSLWLKIPDDIDSEDLAAAALNKGVVIEQGHYCFMQRPPPRNYIRLGFSAIELEDIDSAVYELSMAAKSLM